MSDRDDFGASARRNYARDLTAWAHTYAANSPGKLREAGEWLDREYSTAAVLKRRRQADEHDPSPDIPASAFQLCPSEDMAQKTLQVIRLNSAIIDLRHDLPDLSSAALEDPLPWAFRVVLLVCLATDRDAGAYTAGITEIGGLEWLSDGACRCWASLDNLLEGHDPILHMIEDARHLISRADHKARALANPLLKTVTRQRPEKIQRLFDAIIKLECATGYLLDSVDDPACADDDPDESLSGIYLDWSAAADAALTAVDEAITAAEPSRPRLDESWLADLRHALRHMISVLHPTTVGMDGRSLRRGTVSLSSLQERLAVISKRRLYLMDVQVDTAAVGTRRQEVPASQDKPSERHDPRPDLISYTQSDLDQAIRVFKAKRAPLYAKLKRRIERGDQRAIKVARDVFGRNPLARRLHCKSRAMISKSSAWKMIKRELRLEWKKNTGAGKKVGNTTAETIHHETERPADLVADAEMLERIRLLPADAQASLLEDIATGRKSPEKAEEVIAIYVQQKHDECQRHVESEA